MSEREVYPPHQDDFCSIRWWSSQIVKRQADLLFDQATARNRGRLRSTTDAYAGAGLAFPLEGRRALRSGCCHSSPHGQGAGNSEARTCPNVASRQTWLPWFPPPARTQPPPTLKMTIPNLRCVWRTAVCVWIKPARYLLGLSKRFGAKGHL